MTAPSIRSRARAATAALLTLLALSALAGTAPPAQAKGKPIYWGAQIGRQFTGQQPPWDMNALKAFQRRTKKGLSLLAFYAPFADCTSGKKCTMNGFPTVPLQAVRDYGAIPFLSWSSASSAATVKQPQYRLSKIIHGRYDKYIREWAEASREWGHPYFLRFDWEMNGFWFPWNEGANGNRPGEFVKAWRHVHDIFTEVGATNANWVWCPNIALIPKLKHFASLYPGNRYVDWTCLDGFNWGNTPNSAGWQTFEHVFGSTYREVMQIAPGKPMVLGEVASDERGGSKANWIKHALAAMPTKFPKIRGLVWFDERSQGMKWPIESSKSSERAFQQAIASKLYKPNIYARLLGPKIAPPTFGPPPTEAPAPKPVS
ncbi:MAG TPA: glycosyl hydrolase [Solirubrobacterales bacterium]